MANYNLEILEDQAISVPISKWAYQIAEKFACDETSQQHARQVYLNTLAVYSVKNYLQMLGYSLDLTYSQCWDPIARHVLNVADLTIKGKGVLECRPIEPDRIICKIPPEAVGDRIGYIVVQVNLESQEATFLGFSPSAEEGELSIYQLCPMDEFPQFLYAVKPQIYHLSQWLDHVFEAGVATVEELLGAERVLAFEGIGAFRGELAQQREEKRCIPIRFGAEESSLLLVVTIREGSWPKRERGEEEASDEKQKPLDNKLGIAVEVRSLQDPDFLPAGLCMTLLNEDGEQVGNLLAQMENRELTFKFNAEAEEQFSIQLTLEEDCVTKTFLI